LMAVFVMRALPVIQRAAPPRTPIARLGEDRRNAAG